jgi:chromosome segregation protein
LKERAEFQARLDEIVARVASQEARVHQAAEAVAAAEQVARDAEAAAAQATERRAHADQAAEDARTALARLRDEAEAQVARRRDVEARRAEKKLERASLQAQLDVLLQSEASLAGLGEGARFLLDAARNLTLEGARGALSAALEVPAELETCIAAALGDALDAILLDSGSLDKLSRFLARQHKPRPCCRSVARPQTGLRDPDERCVGVASDLVTVPPEFRRAVDLVLGHTLIARDRAAARHLLGGLPADGRVVSLRGEVFRADGLVVAGGSGGSTNLGRRRKRGELGARATSLEGDVQRFEVELEQANADFLQLQAAVAGKNAAAGQLAAPAAEAQGAEQRLLLEADAARRHVDWLRSELSRLQGETAQTQAAREELQSAQRSMKGEDVDSEALISQLSEQLDEISLDELQAQFTYWTTRTQLLGRRFQGHRNTVSGGSGEAGHGGSNWTSV